MMKKEEQQYNNNIVNKNKTFKIKNANCTNYQLYFSFAWQIDHVHAHDTIASSSSSCTSSSSSHGATFFTHVMRIFIAFQKGGNTMRISLCFSDRRVFLRRISLKCLRRNSALKTKFREKISLCRVSLQLNLWLRCQKKLDVLWEISLKSKLKVGKKTF